MNERELKHQELEYQVSFLNHEIEALAQEFEETQRLIKAFWTGDISEGANIDEVIIAQWGRKRIEAMSNKD